jgi:hypothetical protein
MKDLPSSFSMPPGQESHKYFRNLLIEFKKLLKKSKDIDALQWEMDRILDASKELTWKIDRNKIIKQETGEKAVSKVWHEFKRYLQDLEKSSSKANYQDLFDAIEEIELMLNNFDLK